MTKSEHDRDYALRTWRKGRVFIPIWIGFIAFLTVVFAIDTIWPFGWGSDWDDVLGGLGMIAAGIAFWVVWNWTFQVIHGPYEPPAPKPLGKDPRL